MAIIFPEGFEYAGVSSQIWAIAFKLNEEPGERPPDPEGRRGLLRVIFNPKAGKRAGSVYAYENVLESDFLFVKDHGGRGPLGLNSIGSAFAIRIKKNPDYKATLIGEFEGSAEIVPRETGAGK